jgi:cell division protein FtsI (penicillin-binding protein 3)
LNVPAVQHVFEPGSTFKSFVAAAALEEKVARINDKFDCESGKWKVSGVTIRDHDKEGILTFTEVIERSSNIGTAKIGMRLGEVKLFDYVRAFGFGAVTGSELPGETSGILRPVHKWSGVSLPIISFGQEVGVTAIQLTSAYSALANGGLLLEPRLFKVVHQSDGREQRWPAPALIRRVISEETAGQIKDILKGVVVRGTGQEARTSSWAAAGKTGTAQKFDTKLGRYSSDRYVASFCGFVPADRPRLTIVVILDEPRGLEWGGYNAGPVFKNIAQHALTYLGVEAETGPQLAKGIL